MTTGGKSRLRQLQERHNDQLLTALTVLLLVMMFVVAPVQAAGISIVAVEAFGVLVVLIMAAGVLVLSASPATTFLCNLETIIGQLYPATLLARLVSLEIEGRRR